MYTRASNISGTGKWNCLTVLSFTVRNVGLQWRYTPPAGEGRGDERLAKISTFDVSDLSGLDAIGQASRDALCKVTKPVV
jgi:hypothetical protein